MCWLIYHAGSHVRNLTIMIFVPVIAAAFPLPYSRDLSLPS